MRDNLTEIVLIVDESGSMQHLRSDTVGNINKFIEDQKAIEGDANFTLVFFNAANFFNTYTYTIGNDFSFNEHRWYNMKKNAVDIKNVKPIEICDYNPNGGTALLDAIGQTIDSVGLRLAGMKESERPSKVIFAILTDGEENSSKKYSQAKIKEMITHQETKYSWKFLFLAENINACETARSYGINAYLQNSGGAAGYTEAYNTVSCCVSNLRNSGTFTTGDLKDYSKEKE